MAFLGCFFRAVSVDAVLGVPWTSFLGRKNYGPAQVILSPSGRQDAAKHFYQHFQVEEINPGIMSQPKPRGNRPPLWRRLGDGNPVLRQTEKFRHTSHARRGPRRAPRPQSAGGPGGLDSMQFESLYPSDSSVPSKEAALILSSVGFMCGHPTTGERREGRQCPRYTEHSKNWG